MKAIDIYGDNRFEKPTKTRVACRGIVISDGKILMSYEVKTDQLNRKSEIFCSYRNP